MQTIFRFVLAVLVLASAISCTNTDEDVSVRGFTEVTAPEDTHDDQTSLTLALRDIKNVDQDTRKIEVNLDHMQQLTPVSVVAFETYHGLEARWGDYPSSPYSGVITTDWGMTPTDEHSCEIKIRHDDVDKRERYYTSANDGIPVTVHVSTEWESIVFGPDTGTPCYVYATVN